MLATALRQISQRWQATEPSREAGSFARQRGKGRQYADPPAAPAISAARLAVLETLRARQPLYLNNCFSVNSALLAIR
jgi:hypothetical protein